jgi:hypothetical protein
MCNSPEGIEHKSELRKILLEVKTTVIGMGSNQIRLRDTRYLMAYLYMRGNALNKRNDQAEIRDQ